MRQILYSESFDIAVEKVGGYRVIDDVLELVLDGLYLNPWGFDKFECDNRQFNFRWLTTEPKGEVPALFFQFRILDSNDVEFTHVEPLETY